ncbi:hypothetical protein lerEdw1_012946 [Lerista edwardsae]|nr:hypothetical protein lerEdw1_012946 [Lerista edwardsae]
MRVISAAMQCNDMPLRQEGPLFRRPSGSFRETSPQVDPRELAELIAACPVHFTGQQNAQGQNVVEYKPLSYATLAELRKGIRDMGLTSTYIQGMLEATMRNNLMVPEDWKSTFHMLLNPSQYVVWESEFRHLCAIRGVNSGGAYTPEQIYGSRQFDTADKQIVLPKAILVVSSECAFRAYQKVPASGKPVHSFSTIQQKPTETYSDFINRLQEALKRQIDNLDAQSELLMKLANENATKECHQAIIGLGANPDLANMLKACQDTGTHAYLATMLAAALHQGTKPQSNCKKKEAFPKEMPSPGW